MMRQQSAALDDREAFYAVHIARYVQQKSSHRLGTHAEIDVVTELIEEQWRAIVKRGALRALGVGERLELFHRTVIVFPFMNVPDSWKRKNIVIDFARHARKHTDRCHCGSGLTYGICCGRTLGTDEVLSGAQ